MVGLISDNLIEKHFNTLQQSLLNPSNRFHLQLQRKWFRTFPNVAGVYCFFLDDELCYVGETGCISKRLADLLDTRNHTLRRSIGEKYFSNESGYLKANSQTKYPFNIEDKIEKWMINHLKFSFVPVKIGRKEFEEWLQNSNSNISFFNKRTKRK
jgi:hypothetical protein